MSQGGFYKNCGVCGCIAGVMGYLLSGVMGGLIQHTLLHVPSSISLVCVTRMLDNGEAVGKDAPRRMRST
jgi:chromate transport protein ChrA